MTTEERAKAYDEALERAKQFHNKELYAECNGNLVEYIFPELAESKDEKIRKWLLDFVQGLPDGGLDFHFYNLNKKQVLAWLEKQKLTQSEVTKASEQVWSEDDEVGWTNTMIMIKEVASNHYTKDSVKLVIDWLKSLKYRCIWKPTKEHVKAVRLARSFVTDDFGEHPMLSETLIDLEEQLKKLREG